MLRNNDAIIDNKLYIKIILFYVKKFVLKILKLKRKNIINVKNLNVKLLG